MPVRFNLEKQAEAAQNTLTKSAEKQAKLQEKVTKAEARAATAQAQVEKATAALEAEKASAVEAQEFLDARTARQNAAAAPQGEVVETV
jgi:hypothetical protein